MGSERLLVVASATEDWQDLPSALERARTARGLTRPELASLAGVDRSSVWRAEIGRGIPHPATKRLIAAALGVDEADLFGAGGEA